MGSPKGRKTLLFLKKKKQKDYYSLAPRAAVASKLTKVFWFFFPKKNILSC
jgi:hypothetical protein